MGSCEGGEVPSYEPTSRTTATRHRDRMVYDASTVASILEEAVVCHVGFVMDGAPVVLPTMHARVGDVLYLHGSSGARLLRAASAAGLAVCVTVTLLDGLVLARSQFNHSLNYRSVVVHGTARPVLDPAEKRAGLTAIVEHAVPGRAADSRPPTDKELAATTLLAVPLAESSAKVRAGGPKDDEADQALPHWAGVVPARLVFGPPEPSGAPAYVRGYRRPSA